MNIHANPMVAERSRALSLTSVMPSASGCFGAVTAAAQRPVHVPADLGRDVYTAKGSPPRGELR